MELDRRRFPLTTSYLAELPRGIESYPECTTKFDAFVSIIEDYPSLVDGIVLPDRLTAFFKGYYAGRIMPEVVAQTANLMVRDLVIDSDDAFLEWTYDVSGRLFQKPIFRSLMKLISPTLVAMGAAKRWEAIHQGTSLTTTRVAKAGDRMQTVGVLEFPERLFHPLFCRALSQSFRAGLDGARGRDPRVEMGEITSTRATYLCSWSA